MLYYNGTNTKIETADGLIVKDGTQYQPYIAKTENADDEVDFGSAENVLKYYPQNAGVTGTRETLTRETIGAKTPVKIAGSETYSGDMSLGGFTDTMPYMTSLLMRPNKLKLSENTMGFLYGNGTFTFNANTPQTSNTFRLAPAIRAYLRIPYIDLGEDFNADYLSFKMEDTEGIASEVLSYSEDRISLYDKGNNVLKPAVWLLNSEPLDIDYNIYFKDTMPLKTKITVDIIERSTINWDGKVTKEGTANLSITPKVGNCCIFFEIGGTDAVNVTNVVITARWAQDKLKIKLVNGASNTKVCYISSDVTSTVNLNAGEFVITLEGTDAVYKNTNAIKFDSSNYSNAFKIKTKSITQVAEAEALLWTTKDTDTSSNVVIKKTATWKEFSSCFNNLGNTQALGTFITDDCVIYLDLFILYSGGAYECKGTSLVYFKGSEEAVKKYGKYCYLFSPNTQDAITFNMLLQDTGAKDNERQDIQYVGCECKNLNFNFANKGLTEITSSITALRQINSKVSNVKVAKTEDRASVLVQSSNEPTTVYINCLDTRAITDATFTFEWTKEDSYNIKAEKLIKANSKYNWTFGGNAVYNKVSKDFIDRFNKGENMSIILQAQRTFNNKLNQILICSLKATGVVSEPTIQQGDLTVALSDITGDEVELLESIISNMIIVISDDELLASEIQN